MRHALMTVAITTLVVSAELLTSAAYSAAYSQGVDARKMLKVVRGRGYPCSSIIGAHYMRYEPVIDITCAPDASGNSPEYSYDPKKNDFRREN